MIISGLQKFSLLDFPGHLSAIIFTQGCNFRCQFCYNPMLVWPPGQGKFTDTSSRANVEDIKKDHPLIKEDVLFDFLESRVDKLDALVITGGEPTMHQDLPEFTHRVRQLGFKVKLDTNGTNPKMLKTLIDSKLLNYIAMDLKAPLTKYELVTGVQPDLPGIKKSIKIIMGSDLPYEFRTTLVPELISEEDIRAMGELIKGAEKWFLQQFKSDVALVNPSFEGIEGYARKDLVRLKEIGSRFTKYCNIR